MSFRVCCLDLVLGSFHHYHFQSLSFCNRSCSYSYFFQHEMLSEVNKSCLNWIILVDLLTIRSRTNLANHYQLHGYSFQCLTLGTPNLHRQSVLLHQVAIMQSHLNYCMIDTQPRARKKGGFPVLRFTHLG